MKNVSALLLLLCGVVFALSISKQERVERVEVVTVEERLPEKPVSRVDAQVSSQQSTWFDSFLLAKQSTDSTKRPLIVVIGGEGCAPCELLVRALKKHPELPYDFVYVKHDDVIVGSKTALEVFKLSPKITIPQLVGVWSGSIVPLPRSYFDELEKAESDQP